MGAIQDMATTYIAVLPACIHYVTVPFVKFFADTNLKNIRSKAYKMGKSSIIIRLNNFIKSRQLPNKLNI